MAAKTKRFKPRLITSQAALAAPVAPSGKPKIENWARKPASDAFLRAAELYDKIQRCYDNKQEQADNCEEYWAIYNAKPDENAQYSGNSTCYIPTVRDCIRARRKRRLALLFPQPYRHVEAVGPNAETPTGVLAMLEHYIRSSKLKDAVRADLLAGDVTGQWNLYIDWTRSYRTVYEKVTKPAILQDEDGNEFEDPVDSRETLEARQITTEGPVVTPFAVEDLAVYPPTVDDIEKSVASSIKLRMSRERIERMIDEGIFVDAESKKLIDELGQDGSRDKRVPAKKRSAEAGVRTEGTWKYALIYEVAADLPLGADHDEPALIYFAGRERILGIIRNPSHSGRRPTFSAPIEAVEGSFFGQSVVDPVKYLQWNLNDFWNMGMDSAQYGLLPIVMTDPLKNPQYNTMVMGLAAVWLTDPGSTKFNQFPAIYKDAVQLCGAIKQQIMESMDVTEAMLGRTPQGRKNNQLVGNLMQEQQTNIMDDARRYEDVMLNPILEEFRSLDAQYRSEEITVPAMGEAGVRARMQSIPPQAAGSAYSLFWTGTSFQMNMQLIQSRIAWMNVLRGVPPQQLAGRRLDVTPIIESGTEALFGPEVAPRILIDERNQFSIDPEEENVMLANGLTIDVHPGDDDPKHLQAHQRAALMTQDLAGMFRGHMQKHVAQLQAKRQAAMGPPQQGQPGVPGGGQQPGVAGMPAPGAQPGLPRPQGPPGMIHQDALAGAPGRG